MSFQYTFGGIPITLEPNYNRRQWEVIFNNQTYFHESEDKPTLLECVHLIFSASVKGND